MQYIIWYKCNVKCSHREFILSFDYIKLSTIFEGIEYLLNIIYTGNCLMMHLQ